MQVKMLITLKKLLEEKLSSQPKIKLSVDEENKIHIYDIKPKPFYDILSGVVKTVLS